jgi:hypothetical protein
LTSDFVLRAAGLLGDFFGAFVAAALVFGAATATAPPVARLRRGVGSKLGASSAPAACFAASCSAFSRSS